MCMRMWFSDGLHMGRPSMGCQALHVLGEICLFGQICMCLVGSACLVVHLVCNDAMLQISMWKTDRLMRPIHVVAYDEPHAKIKHIIIGAW